MPLPTEMPILRNAAVELRGFTRSDLATVLEASADPYIPLVTSVPTVPVVAEAEAYIERQQSRLVNQHGYSFAIADAASGRAVGQIGLWLQDLAQGRGNVGYWVANSARRRGYARAALDLLSAWALDFPVFHRLQLCVEPWNEASWRAAEGAGYVREGLLRSWQSVGGERRDMFMYARLRVPTPHEPVPGS